MKYIHTHIPYNRRAKVFLKLLLQSFECFICMNILFCRSIFVKIYITSKFHIGSKAYYDICNDIVEGIINKNKMGCLLNDEIVQLCVVVK